MSTTALLSIAVVVFSLMVTGLFATMREFQKAEDPSTRKGASNNSRQLRVEKRFVSKKEYR